MQDFRNLKVWQKATALSERLEDHLPKIAKRKPGLAKQIDQAAASIPANIAEGCGRETKADFKRFLTMGIGSSTELENHLIRARSLKLLTAAEFASLLEATIEIRKMLHGLRKSLGN